MAKPEIITLPFVLLLWDYWPLKRVLSSQFSVLSEKPAGELAVAAAPRSFSFLLLEKVPLLLLSAASGVITLLAQRAGHAVRSLPASERWGNAIVAYVRYLGKAFWPSRLAVLYPHPGDSLPVWEVVAGGCGFAFDYCACVSLAGASLSGRGLALVPGYAGACDRHRLGRRAGDGRSLCLFTLHRIVCVRGLERRGDRARAEDFGGVAGGAGGFDFGNARSA